MILNNYNELLLEIKNLIENRQKNLQQIINRQKIEVSWKIGKMISEYLLKNNKAEYGEQLFNKLEKDILISKSNLYQMQNFYKAYPDLPSAETVLSWTHYSTLATLKDFETRKYFEKLTIENELSVKDLKEEIAQTTVKKNPNPKPIIIEENTTLDFTRGKLYSYQLTSFENSNKKFVDCGFNIFSEIKTDIGVGKIVKSSKNENGYFLEEFLGEPSKNLHTYKAYLERVVDGDTLRVILDLGFGIYHKEILRLAKINASERSTSNGDKSTKALGEILKNVKFLIIKTNKIDIYGRYIADVFFSESNEEDAQKVADEGIYLNQLLVDLKFVSVAW